MKEKYTGERLETTIYNGNTVNHLHRYAIAINYIKDKIVLDIASGEGYGSNLMCDHAAYVFGVDIDNDVIEKAKKKYIKKNLEFIVGTTSNIPISNNSVDVVISFETIEHHDQHEKMLKEIKRVLRPNGLLVISSPDKHYYSDKRNYKNVYHVKELYKSEFISLINNYFNNYQILSQSYLNGNSLIFNEITRMNIEFFTGTYYKLKNTFSNPHFLIAICSDGNFNKLNNSIFDGGLLFKTRKDYENFIKNVYKSNSYRLGHTILVPLKLLKRGFKKLILFK